MPKQIAFTNQDKELIAEINTFRKAQKLPSFVAAVRLLCQNGLRMSDVVKNLK